eukprot:6172013-Pleurochrysis_carterae.AAC.3
MSPPYQSSDESAPQTLIRPASRLLRHGWTCTRRFFNKRLFRLSPFIPQWRERRAGLTKDYLTVTVSKYTHIKLFGVPRLRIMLMNQLMETVEEMETRIY